MLFTYISKVNFILESKSPANILIKLSTKDFSVTCSSTLSVGDYLSFELLLVAYDILDKFFLFNLADKPINIKCNLSLIMPGSLVYSIKFTLSK